MIAHDARPDFAGLAFFRSADFGFLVDDVRTMVCMAVSFRVAVRMFYGCAVSRLRAIWSASHLGQKACSPSR